MEPSREESVKSKSVIDRIRFMMGGIGSSRLHRVQQDRTGTPGLQRATSPSRQAVERVRATITEIEFRRMRKFGLLGRGRGVGFTC